MALRIAIEGNISAGKSTLLSILSKELDFLVVPEPVDKWQSIDNDNEDDAALGLQSESQESGMNLLDLFYQDAKRWGYTFQTYAFLSRIRAQLRPFEEFQQNAKLYNVKTSHGFRENKKQKLTNGDARTTTNGVATSEDEKENALSGNASSFPSDECARLVLAGTDETVFHLRPGTTTIGLNDRKEVAVSEQDSSEIDKCAEIMANKQSNLFVVKSIKPLTIKTRGELAGSSETTHLSEGSIEQLGEGAEICIGNDTVKFHLVPGNESNTTHEDTSKANAAYSNLPLQDKILLYERSVLSDRYCFAANCRKTNLFQDVEWRIYCDWHNFLLKSFDGLRLDGLVYLRTSPKTCHSRLQKRGRAEESSVGLDYLDQLHRRHEDWLIERKVGKEHKLPVLVIDTDTEFETDPKRTQEILDLMRRFVDRIKGTKKRKSEEKPLKRETSDIEVTNCTA